MKGVGDEITVVIIDGSVIVDYPLIFSWIPL